MWSSMVRPQVEKPETVTDMYNGQAWSEEAHTAVGCTSQTFAGS